MRRLTLLLVALTTAIAGVLAAAPSYADEAPLLSGVSTAKLTLFPYRDGYRDSVTVPFTLSAPAHMQLRVFRSDDTERTNPVSMDSTLKLSTGTHVLTYTGHTENGHKIGSGNYVIVLTATSDDERSATAEIPLVSSSKGYRPHHYTRIVSVGSTAYYKHAGRCSTVQNGVNGWYRGIGLHSNTRCHKSANDSLAVTNLAVRVPTAARYTNVRANFTGGANRSRPGSTAVAGYITPRGQVVGIHKFTSSVNYHRLGVGAASLIRHTRNGNYVLVYVGTAYGDRYDLRTVAMDTSYSVFE